jgi:hypothetical protein
MTAITARSHFDEELGRYQKIPSKGMILNEVDIPPHPLKKDRTSPTKFGPSILRQLENEASKIK